MFKKINYIVCPKINIDTFYSTNYNFFNMNSFLDTLHFILQTNVSKQQLNVHKPGSGHQNILHLLSAMS